MKSMRLLAAFILAGLSLIILRSTASAHGHTEVGDYALVIGFHTEPAYQGEPNALDLFVTNHDTGEPVNGLEETLQVEIIYGSATRALALEPQFGQEGAYTAHLIPTAAGDYTWHIFGTIKDTPVDVRMTSGPETFGSIEAKSSAAFPAMDAHQFSPDGRTIYFSAVNEQVSQPAAKPLSWLDRLLGAEAARAHSLPSDWYRVSVEGGPAERLTRLEATGLSGALSPDGQHLAFLCDQGLFVVGADGQGLVRLAQTLAVGTLEWIE